MAEQLVAGAVPERVVDALEPVEIEEDERDQLVGVEGLLDVGVQPSAVRELRERIDLRADPRLGERSAGVDHEPDLHREGLEAPDALDRRQQAVERVVGEDEAEVLLRGELDRDQERLAVPAAPAAATGPVRLGRDLADPHERLVRHQERSRDHARRVQLVAEPVRPRRRRWARVLRGGDQAGLRGSSVAVRCTSTVW